MTKPPPMSSNVQSRAEQLDTIAAVLPMNRRDRLAEILTNQDVETPRHLVNEGMGENTLRALTSDLAYLEAWAMAATGSPLPFPASEALLLKFVAHHLWRPQQREIEPNHGMPVGVEDQLRAQGFLRVSGPHAPATVRRRLANWSTLTRWRGLEGSFSSPSVKSAIRLAVRALNRPRSRKSVNAITGDILGKLLATCSGEDLTAMRDRAILMVAFASGGRRRSEVASLRVEQLVKQAPVTDENGSPLPSPRWAFISVAPKPVAPITMKPSISPAVPSKLSPAGWKQPGSTRAACFEKSIAGAMLRREHSSQAPSTGSSNSGPKWLALMRLNSRPTACAPSISPKPPIAAYRCQKQWNNRVIVPCSRRPTIITTPNGAADGHRCC
ncbi:phage integrase [Brucella pinnipedialis B2/94]|uniref:Phage integrase n=2 Tax=Brucella pinnipedialis TaxID=120576 RepID=A0A0E1X781_9HYPH|nr:phage integrase [Brucella pinnipedialis B2/94]EEZ29037.1 phage integrase [Brucella pinnipedialis M292/94/1]